MVTATLAGGAGGWPLRHCRWCAWSGLCRFVVLLSLAAAVQFIADAGPLSGPWTPLFKGIDLAVGTNDPSISGNFSELQAVRCVRVDLTDPDVSLFTTPQAPNPVPEYEETLTQTVPSFLQQNNLQIASDANYYSASPGGADPTSPGLPCEVYGLQISDGTLISAQTTADAAPDPRYAAMLFGTNNQPDFIFVNLPPGTNTAGVYNAITGYYPIVSNGVNIGAASISAYPDSYIHQSQPRTAFGLSQDRRYLFVMTIDGRQPGYSMGALDAETAYWMLQFGAWNAINMDGGGSTALYMADTTGNPVGLNHSSYLAQYGRERYVGSHFGVYANPLPGFINNVLPQPDDTAATITWTTLEPATTQVQYGLTPALGSFTPVYSTMVTNHSALLTNLAPATPYYFQIIANTATSQYLSSNYLFVTTNYVTSTLLFDLSNTWNYMTADLDGINWTTPGYDDSGWDGSGPGLLWVDTRGFANPNIPVPMLTQMPANPSTGYPYLTYYFRTHFSFTNSLSGVTLLSTDYLDDGAVFYLNGTEIYRLRMLPAPTQILNATLASGYPCSNSVDYGDAVCPDYWSVSGNLITNLLLGDNVLAVEAHNYSAQSPDITFGLALAFSVPHPSNPQLNVMVTNGVLNVSWNRGGFTLQQADSPTGPWSAVPGPVVSSPFTTSFAGANRFYRLIK